MREKRDDQFSFRGNILSRLPNPVELSHKYVLTNFKYEELEFYSRLFDESEKGPFELPPVFTKNDCILCSLSYTFDCVGDNSSDDCYKYGIKH